MNETQAEDSPFVWNTLEVDEDGYVVGDVFAVINGDYDVSAWVSSYSYNDGVDTNHVPMAIITEKDGTIVHEGELNDADNPMKAMARARGAAKWYCGSHEQFVD